MEKNIQKTEESIQRTAETMGDTLVALVDKLAGTESDLKLSFEDLTLDAGAFKAKINGAIVLDMIMAKKAEGSISKATESATNYAAT
jgi:hypothetical protein